MIKKKQRPEKNHQLFVDNMNAMYLFYSYDSQKNKQKKKLYIA